MNLHPRFSTARAVLALGAWLLATPHPSAAQTAATTFSQLENRVPAGATVIVETVDGRKIKGQLRGVSETGLVLFKANAPTVPAEAIRTVSSRTGRRPALRNVMVGMTLGALAGVVYMAAAHEHSQPCSARDWGCGWDIGPSTGDMAAFLSVIGAGVGAGVGALMPPPMRVVYRAPSPSRVSIAPFVTPERRGVALSMTF